MLWYWCSRRDHVGAVPAGQVKADNQAQARRIVARHRERSMMRELGLRSVDELRAAYGRKGLPIIFVWPAEDERGGHDC